MTEESLADYVTRLEQENRELKAYKDVNEDFKKAWDELNKKYTEVLKLAKENADSNEYCLQELEQERDKLKAELHSKVEFIQEQRTIINEYAKEIEIYKQCQGKRASKREEELKQENKELKEEIRFHNKENSNLLAERNAAQIGYDEIREVRERYRSALEEIQKVIKSYDLTVDNGASVDTLYTIRKIINEVLN